MDINKNTVLDFDPFAIEDIPKEVLNKIRDKSILNDIFRMQNRDSIICGFYCTTFIEYMLAETTFYIIPIYLLLSTMKEMTR